MLDKEQIFREFEKLNPQDPKGEAKKDRKATIERDKKLYSVGYRIYKEDKNRPPTPDGSDPNQVKAWRLEIEAIQGSEDIEISPSEVQEMISEFKKTHPFSFYDEMIPRNHELRVIKTPEPEFYLRGDEWDEMYKKWRKEVGTFMSSGPGNDYVRAQGKKKANRPNSKKDQDERDDERKIERTRIVWDKNDGEKQKNELRNVIESRRKKGKKSKNV